MNTNSRLEKLESKRGTGPIFCTCFEQHFKAAVEAIYADSQIPEGPHEIDGVCSLCRRSLGPATLQMNQHITAIYGGLE